MTTIELSSLKANPNNPRDCRKDKFEKLKKSIVQDPEFMVVRPIVIDENRMILGGNQRYHACIALGLNDVPESWVKQVFGWPEDKKRAFIIKDNVAIGDWDWEILANEWDEIELAEWGLDLPEMGAVNEEDLEEERPSEEFSLKINFASMEDLEAAKIEIQKSFILSYPGAYISP